MAQIISTTIARTNMGEVGATVSGTDTILVTATGVLSSQYSVGIIGNAGGNTATIYGHVMAPHESVKFSGSENLLMVGASGTLTSTSYYAVALGENNTVDNAVVNYGSIVGEMTGLYIRGTRISVYNAGTIAAKDYEAIYLVSNEASTEPNRIVNDGLLIGGKIVDGGGVLHHDAIYASNLSENVINNGHIEGRVFLNDGNDTYDGHLGTIAGLLDLAWGDDLAIGGSGSETIKGSWGNDTVDGGAGIDTYLAIDSLGSGRPFYVDLRIEGPQDTGEGLDIIRNIENVISSDDHDRLTGNNADNVLTASGGNDTLEGWGGSDVLDGGAGIDTARFSGAIGATVDLSNTGLQNTGYGFDKLIGIENLEGGSGADRFTGDANGNVLTGNSGNDWLEGGAGADTLQGGDGADTASYQGSASGISVNLATGTGADGDAAGDSYSAIENLSGSLHADKLTGNAVANVIKGWAGDDQLFGAAGADQLYGGLGNDVLSGGTENDTLLGEAGADTLYGDAGNDRLYGGTENDVLYGGAGNDQLKGDAGNDKLYGGLGKDVLSGGAGSDIFVFDSKPNLKTNLDRIADFNVKDDTIHLSQKVFSKIAKKGVLVKDAFWIGDAAHDASDRIIYNKATGALFYDVDGSGSAAAVQIATLSKNLRMTEKDFYLF